MLEADLPTGMGKRRLRKNMDRQISLRHLDERRVNENEKKKVVLCTVFDFNYLIIIFITDNI